MNRVHARASAAAVWVLILAACSGSNDTEVGDDGQVDAGETQVDTTIEELVAPETPAPTTEADAEAEDPKPRYETDDAEVLFDQSVVHTFEINLPDEALAELDADPAAEEYVKGSLTFDGETIDPIGIRYKGSVGAFFGCTDGANPFEPSGPKQCSKLSIKLKINWDGADTEFYGQRKIQLHSMNLDPSLMRDRLGYLMFAEAGVAAPRATHARVVVNGELVGLFALVEQIDGRFVRDRFEDGEGNLYKEVWPFDAVGDVQSADSLIAGLETNEKDDPSPEIMQAFARTLLTAGAATDQAAAREVLDAYTELDSFVTYAVVDRAIHHDDGPFHWYCGAGPCESHNFYFYEEPTSETVHIIPWDLDNAMQHWPPDEPVSIGAFVAIADEFGETRNNCLPFPYGSFGIPQRSAACDPLVAAWSLLDEEFARIDDEFRSGPFAIENVSELVETWRAQIAPHVAEAAAVDPQALTVDAWNESLDQLLADIAAEPSRQES